MPCSYMGSENSPQVFRLYSTRHLPISLLAFLVFHPIIFSTYRCGHAMAHLWRSEALQQLELTSHLLPLDQTLVAMCDAKFLYPLSHPVDPLRKCFIGLNVEA